MPETIATGIEYSRRVSFNERIYLAAERLQPGFCIQIVVEGEGQREGAIAVEALTDAVARATEANPGARLILSGFLGWTRWVPRGPRPPVRVVEGWSSGDAPPTDVERVLSPTVGPTCEVVLAPGATPRVVFRCFHGVMDARGLLHFAEEVFRALRGEPLVGGDCTLNDTEVVESTVGDRRRPFLASDCAPLTVSKSTVKRGISWERVTLEGPMPGLVARIAATLARHAARRAPTPTPTPTPTRVMIPVDVRNYRRELRATGNLTFPIFLDVAGDRSWRDLQKEILKRLAAKEPMRLDPGEKILPWLPLWLVCAFYAAWTGHHRRTRRYPFTALVTHVALQGVSPLNARGFTSRSLYFLPPQSDFIPLGIAAVSGPDAAQIVVSAPRHLASEAELAELCAVLVAGVSDGDVAKRAGQVSDAAQTTPLR